MEIFKCRNLIFYGLGGAGQRHLRFLQRYFKDKLNFFAYRKKNKVQYITNNFKLTRIPLSKKYKNIKFLTSYKKSLNQKVDYAFVCGPTSKNYSIVKDCIEKKRNIFVEKPFILTLKNFFILKKKINKLNLKILVGYQRRFHPLVQKLKKLLKKNNKNKKIKVYIKVKSYVPDWHKYEDFKNLYACKKKLGGGALYTECHEIDLCIFLFGMPKKIFCKKYFSKKIGIDVETSYKLKLFYNHVSVYLKVDMFCKDLERTIKIFDQKKQYRLDLLNNNLVIKCNNIKHFFSKKNLVDVQFINQIKYFFSTKFDLNKSLTQIENNMRVLIACNRSHQLKRVVHLN